MKTIQQLLHRPWLYMGIVIIGIGLKFYGIESKYFWYDEIETIMHVSGISDLDYPSLVPVNKINNISYYHDLLHLNIQDYTIGSQLKGLFSMPQLTPLHPTLLIFWHRIAGDDYIHYRLFNVFLFIMLLPCLFLLCKTLFGSNLSGWIAVSLFSVSPFFNIYTQEACYIMLWAFFTIICHCIFLKAVQNNNIKWWIGYAFIAVLTLYTSLVSSLVLLGHLIFIFIQNKKLRIQYCISLFAVFLFYLPWMVTMYNNLDEILRSLYWHKYWNEINVLQQIPGQLLGIATLFVCFVDYTIGLISVFSGGDLPDNIVLIGIPTVYVLVLITFAIVYFLKNSSKDIRYFLLLITLPSIMFIMIMDIIRNGWLSFIWRYHVISLIGILLIITNYLYEKIKEKKNLFFGIFLSLIILATISIFNIAKIKCWTIGGPCEDWDNYMMAEKLLNSDRTLIITDFTYWAGIGGFLEVMAKVENEDIDILYALPDNDCIDELIDTSIYSYIFLMHTSDKLLENIKLNVTPKIDSLAYCESSWATPMWQIRY